MNKLLITKPMSRAAGNGTKVTKVSPDGSTSLYVPLCPETGYNKAMPCHETHELHDPIPAIDSGRQLDYEFYAERQIRPLITQLLSPIVGQKRASQIIESIAGPRVMREHLRRDESATGLCYNCRAKVEDGQGNGLCSACEAMRDDLIYVSTRPLIQSVVPFAPLQVCDDAGKDASVPRARACFTADSNVVDKVTLDNSRLDGLAVGIWCFATGCPRQAGVLDLNLRKLTINLKLAVCTSQRV